MALMLHSIGHKIIASDAQQDVAHIRGQVQQFRQLGDQVLSGNTQIGLAAQSMTELADQLSVTVSQFKL